MNEFISASTPAAESPATVELRSILSDPSHRLHGPLMRGDADANAYVDSLYKRDFPNPGAPPAKTDPNGTVPSSEMPLLTQEDRAARSAYEETLRQHFGDEFDTVMTNMEHGMKTLCTTPESVKALDAFTEAISGLGPLAEIRSIRFLSELGELARNRQ